MVYTVHGGSESDQQELDELLKELDALNAEKAELKKKIALTKNCKVCPECDSLCKNGGPIHAQAAAMRFRAV